MAAGEGGRIHPAHVPSSGRLRELLFPGNEVWIEERIGEGRATAGTIHLARGGTDLVCIHTGLTNLLAVEAWRMGFLPELEAYEECRREVALRCLVEVGGGHHRGSCAGGMK